MKLKFLSMALWLFFGQALSQSVGEEFPALVKEEKLSRILVHLRESIEIPSWISLRVTRLEPSELPSFQKASVSLQQGENSQNIDLHITGDYRHYFVGKIYDLSVDLDRQRESKIQTEGAHSQGQKNAPVTIVEYSDFQCEFCKKAHQALSEEIPKLGKKVRWIFKHYPLSRYHFWAENAAIAAECSANQKKEGFWLMADYFFKEQKEITKENLREKAVAQAEKIKLDLPAFTKCYDQAETRGKVLNDIKEAQEVGVGSVPTFFVNGHPLRGFDQFGPMAVLINQILEKKHPWVEKFHRHPFAVDLSSSADEACEDDPKLQELKGSKE